MILLNTKRYSYLENELYIHLSNISVCTEIILALEDKKINTFAKKRIPNLTLLSQKLECQDFKINESVKLLKNSGFDGSMINHHDFPINYEEIKLITDSLVDNQFKLVICVDEKSNHSEISKLHFDIILYEPSYLIGTSSDYFKEEKTNLNKLSEYYPRSKMMLGGGINQEKDIKEIYEEDYLGFAISSYIMKDESFRNLYLISEFENRYAR